MIFRGFGFPSKCVSSRIGRWVLVALSRSLCVVRIAFVYSRLFCIEFILGNKISSLKVVDFGNAFHCIHDEMSLYYDGFELQTLIYRAPEVTDVLPRRGFRSTRRLLDSNCFSFSLIFDWVLSVMTLSG